MRGSVFKMLGLSTKKSVLPLAWTGSTIFWQDFRTLGFLGLREAQAQVHPAGCVPQVRLKPQSPYF